MTGPAGLQRFKIALTAAVLLFMVVGLLSLRVNGDYGGVEWYEFASACRDSTVEPKVLDRGFRTGFLSIHAGDTPFSFRVELGKRPGEGRRALWVFASRANDHGRVTFSFGGEPVGTIDNLVEERVLAEPEHRFVRVGEVEIGEGDAVFEVTGSSDKLQSHFAEMALLILAPSEMEGESIAALLTGRDGRERGVDFGFVLLFLGISFYALWVIRGRGKGDERNLVLENRLTFAVLAAVAVYAAVCAGTRFTPPPLAARAGEVRSGVERALDSSIRRAVRALDGAQKTLLPSRAVVDEVPERLRTVEGTFKTSIYVADHPAGYVEVSKNILWGALDRVQSMPYPAFRLLWLSLFALFAVFAALTRLRESKWLPRLALAHLCALSVTASMRLSEGWDEFFINLRHAYNLANHGVYGVNVGKMLEGTVDFLPLFLTALLGKLGVDLVDGYVILSLAGNVALIFFSYALVRRVTGDRSWGLAGALLAGLYPNALWVGATGFSAVLFTAWMVGAAYFLLFTRRRALALFLLATLTLVRTEGVLFAALLMSYSHVIAPLPKLRRTGEWKPAARRALGEGGMVASPFLLSLVVRKLLYGHAIPNPISFKNTGFDSAYLSTGLDQFVKIVSNHDLHLMALAAGLLFWANRAAWRDQTGLARQSAHAKKLAALCAVFFAFTLPYYLGGGDWFPIMWNRYGMPFNVILLLTLVALSRGAFRGLGGRVGAAALALFVAALLFSYGRSAGLRQDNFVFGTLRTIEDPSSPANHKIAYAVKWDRVDKLASLGHFLDETLPPDAVVASPEEATIMYFARREMLGLLGVSNPEMAAMPLQPLGPGDVMHRRRGHLTVAKNRPDVIALYVPVMAGRFPAEIKPGVVANVLKRYFFFEDRCNVAFYRVGSFRALEAMGYSHVSVLFSDRIFSFFIHRRSYPYFADKLAEKGFRFAGEEPIPYKVDGRLSSVYLPAATELLDAL